MSVESEPGAAVAARGVTSASSTTGGSRVVGVGVARGVALIGMMATHAFSTLEGGEPTIAAVVAGG